tara:strand:- start:1934 stop:2305 length:372 start_codon:yes stop_codon:yes gene_type:complete
MKKWKSFVIPFVLTIILYRIYLLFISPNSFQHTDSFHHAYIGILILVVVGLIYGIKKRANMIIFGIGLGMLIDEIFLLFSSGFGYEKYWDGPSVYGTAALTIVTVAIYFILNHFKEKRFKSLS